MDSRLAELFDALPLSAAMPDLLPAGPAQWAERVAAVETDFPPSIRAGLWLYVDDLERSHAITQGVADSVGAYWHGIMHRREGDFWNSKYWLRQARSVWGTREFTDGLQEDSLGFDPCAFVDEVEAAAGENPSNLVELQRKEWMALFSFCLTQQE